jgi:peptide-methionine (S)-S-oxide reductase
LNPVPAVTGPGGAADPPTTLAAEENAMLFDRFKTRLPSAEEALPGRAEPAFSVPARHDVLGNALLGPYPEGLEVADFALGCFWGAERKFWQVEGVWTTLVGYQGGHTPHPTYEEACSGRTGHAEAVRVVFDPAVVSYEDLLRVFWESHDPTQGFRQGNDVGTAYRSAIFTHTPAQAATAAASRDAYQSVLARAGYGAITTELTPAPPFYPAESYHQQYLHKNPAGYCGLGGTGVSCPIGVARAAG